MVQAFRIVSIQTFNVLQVRQRHIMGQFTAHFIVGMSL